MLGRGQSGILNNRVEDISPDILRLISESRDKFRTLVDGIEDSVMSLNPDYRIVTVNQAMAREQERHPRELIGLTCHQMLYGFDRPCPEYGLPCPMETSRRSASVEVVLHELPPDLPEERKERFVEVRAMPVLIPGDELREVIMVRRDVTIQHKAEIQLKKYNEILEQTVLERTQELRAANEALTLQRNELAEANAELLDLQRVKEDLTNMVVHDLKGPLSEITANLEMLATEDLVDMQVEFVDGARVGGEDLLRMITNLLDVSRMEEDRLMLDFEPVMVLPLLKRIRERYTKLADLNDVTIEMSVPEDLPPVCADHNLLERIFNNLFSNAVDYTPAGGFIRVSTQLDDNVFQFEVSDTGQGIPPDIHDKIFEKFSQGHGGRPKTSSGLGLTFCKMAVDAHGGDIRVQSQPGQGSRFIFTLPRTRAECPDGLPEDDRT
jgi:signal transduction histidine kinase